VIDCFRSITNHQSPRFSLLGSPITPFEIFQVPLDVAGALKAGEDE
jgi:hypothetical protein